MRWTMTISLLCTVACGSASWTETRPCALAFDDTSADLVQLHLDAGRSRPALPDRETWVKTCQSLSLSPEATACVGARYAVNSPDTCAIALAGVDRSALDEAFLVIMLSNEK
ncbi:MAG: hypothetical protein GWP91_24940 [Rhodobacterales bacterium]|nr:hypothetical protein [Rhodobacterales bacterium]